MIELMSWAKQKARNSATEGRSVEWKADQHGRWQNGTWSQNAPMKKNECDRVTKMRACEIWATSIERGGQRQGRESEEVKSGDERR